MRLLILGTGGQASDHANVFGAIDGVELVGAVDLDANRLAQFSETHKIAKRFNSLSDALDWGKFDAVANVTPDLAHHATTLDILGAGKHVFCEKPLATNYADALEMAQKAEQAGLIGMVNLSYRNVPHIHKARAMIESGEIGEVKHVEASYLQSWLVSKLWGDWRKEAQWLWRLSRSHGSNGTLGDIGIHILDFVSFGARVDITSLDCRLQTFQKSEGDRIGDYDLDANDSFVMSVGFENGALGVVHASRWATGHINELKLRIYGEKGSIDLVHRHDGSQLRACTGDDVNEAKWHDVGVSPVPTNYQKFVDAVQNKQGDQPSFRHAANLQKILDLCFVADGDGARHEV